MDRLRLRFWDKEECQYLKPSFFDSIWFDKDGGIHLGCYSDIVGKVVDYTNEVDIERCTGLKDKNGNLIYEGDIVKCDRDFSENGRKNLIRKVIFADGSFQLERAKTIGDRYYINAFHNFEIIGNIHKTKGNDELESMYRNALGI